LGSGLSELFDTILTSTPIWGRVIFAIIGLAALAVAGGMSYAMAILFIESKPKPIMGFIAPLVIMAVGFGCLYKSMTK
jgi:hypothetical protein